MSTLLLLDVANLMHRSLWAHGDLHDGEQFTGCLFGILRDCLAFQETFSDATFAFAFDSKHKTGRQAILPGYKSARQEKQEMEDDEAKEKRFSMYEQTKQLWSLLPQMGAVNRLGVKGFEADDLIASVVQNTSTSFELAVIVSGDEDLYQLLDAGRVVQYKPISKKVYTAEMLMDEYGLQPCQWAAVKAWAGCASDSVPGLKGVAEKSAAKWLLGKASEKHKALFEANLEMYNRNIQLVKLPFAGCPKLVAKPQETPINWEILAEKIGMPTLPPRGIRV